MKVKVRKILLCVFFALFIVTLFTASFSLGRYSSVQSSESDYDDDFEYTLYDSIVVNTIDEFFAAISNGYNYIIIGDAIKDPLIIAGSMSDIRDDLIIDLNGHEIQRNSRDPLLNVTTGFTLTIIDSEGTGSMYNPVGSVIQVSGGTLTVQNGIFESGPRSDNSRNGDSAVNYNEYVQTKAASGELYSTPGGGSIESTESTGTVTLYKNPIIRENAPNSEGSATQYTRVESEVQLPIITPQTVTRYPNAEDDNKTVISGSMYFDSGTWDTNEVPPWYPYITNDTYLYYTYEAENMQFSEAADKSTANYYYQYEDENLGTITVYVYNDVKKYANNGYYPVDSSSDNTGFAAVKMQEGNLYVRGGTYYSYFGEENTFGVQSTGGLMTVNPTGSNAINFYAYQNGVCVECTVDEPTKTEMLNISSGKFYSELGDTVRVKNGSLTIGTADFTKDVGNADASDFGDNGNVIDISGGTLIINTRAGFDVSGSGVRGIYSHKGDAETRVTVTNATFTFNGTNNLHHNCGIYAEDGNVSCYGNTTINLSNGANNNRGIYSAGNGYIAFGLSGDNVTTLQTTINVATVDTSLDNYGIYSEGGRIYGYGTTNITLGAKSCYSTNSQGIYSTGGTINLGEQNSQDEITITVYGNNSATGYSTGNFGIQTSSGTINAHGAIDIDVTGVSSSGILATTGSTINVYGVIDCTIDMASSDNVNTELSSPAVYVNGGNIVINSTATTEETHSTITSDGFGLVVNDGDITVTNGRIDVTTTRTTAVYLTGGKLDIAEAATMNVNSTINADCEWAMGDDASLQGANIYNGVFVNGGSLTANGTLNVTHQGVENDQSVSGNDAFLKQTVKSFAVRVENSTGVNIAGGEISNAIGGGIYVGGGNVYLGATCSGGKYAQSANADDIKVSTTGAIAGNKIYFNGAATWSYDLLRTGGHAVEVSGGSLTVYGGTYSAAQGNGILVRNTSDSVANVTIEDGTFIGRNGGCGKYGANNKNVGPGVFYGLYVVGGNLNVVINNGTFGELNGESNSGASFYGTYGMSQRATVDIYKGKFYGHSADAISVFRFITINIGSAVQSDGSEIIIQTDNNDAAPLSAQDDFVEMYDDDRGSNINIYYGTFIGGRYDSGGYYNPYLKNNDYDNINEYGRRNTTGNNPDNVKTVFSYPKY